MIGLVKKYKRLQEEWRLYVTPFGIEQRLNDVQNNMASVEVCFANWDKTMLVGDFTGWFVVLLGWKIQIYLFNIR